MLDNFLANAKCVGVFPGYFLRCQLFTACLIKDTIILTSPPVVLLNAVVTNILDKAVHCLLDRGTRRLYALGWSKRKYKKWAGQIVVLSILSFHFVNVCLLFVLLYILR